MDFWDWLKGLRTWWWMILVFPLLAASITWLVAPEPEYESSWTFNAYLDDPERTNDPSYFDFIFLDDFAILLRTSVLGDVMYLRLPEDVQSALTRQEFGEMFTSSRKANFVEVTVSGHDPELLKSIAITIQENVEEVGNFYLIPPTYAAGSLTVNVLDPISEPVLNERPRLVAVGSITMATLLVSVAATGIAEWLRQSHRAKYSER